MDEKESVERSVKRGSQGGSRHKRYTFEEKLRAVKLHRFTEKLVGEETGVLREHALELGGGVPQGGGDGAAEAVVAPAGAESASYGVRQDPGDEAGKPVFWGEEDSRRPAAVTLPR